LSCPSISCLDLNQLLFMKDFVLTCAVVRNVSSSDCDELAKHLVRVFSAAKELLTLLDKLLEIEISNTGFLLRPLLTSTSPFHQQLLVASHHTLLRSNTPTSKMITSYSRIIGTKYLQQTLKPFMKHLQKQGNLEVNPQKMTESEVAANTQKLSTSVSELLNSILKSLEDVPRFNLSLFFSPQTELFSFNISN